MPKDYERPEYESNIDKYNRKNNLIPLKKNTNNNQTRFKTPSDDSRVCYKCGFPVSFPHVFCENCKKDINREYDEI